MIRNGDFHHEEVKSCDFGLAVLRLFSFRSILYLCLTGNGPQHCQLHDRSKHERKTRLSIDIGFMSQFICHKGTKVICQKGPSLSIALSILYLR